MSRDRAAQFLLAAAEVALVAAVAVATLLYSPSLADNLLGKTAVVHLAGGVAVCLWGLARSLDGRLRRPRSPVTLPFAAFLAVAALAAALRARNPLLAWETWLGWAQWLALFVVVADLAADPRRARRLVVALLGLLVVVSVVGLLQVAGIDPIGLPDDKQGLALSTLGNTNFVAHYLEVVLPLALTVAVVGGWTRPVRFAAAAGLALGSALLVLAGSRGGWLGVGAALLAIAIAMVRYAANLRGWGRRFLFGLLVAGLLSPVAGFVLGAIRLADGQTAAAAITATADAVWERGMTTFDPANFSRAMRLLIWRDSVRLVRAHPWLGVGPGHFGLELPEVRTTTAQREWRQLMVTRTNQPFHAHNEFLEVWSETGVFGAAALTWLLGAALWAAWRLARRPGVPRASRSLALGCLGGVLAATVHAAFSFNLRDPVSGTHLWVLCGLVAGAGARPPGETRSIPAGVPRRLGVLVLCAGVAVAGVYDGLCMLFGDVYYLRSRQRLAEGHGNRAILALRQAVDWRGFDFTYHHWLGHVALEMGRPEEAVEALRRSLELHRHNPGAIRLLARALLDLRRGGEAVEPLRHAIDIDALTADNYSLLADALRQSGAAASAVTARRQAISLRGDARSLVALALDHHAAGHLDSALAVLEQAAHTAPGEPLVVGNLGVLQVEAGTPAAAEASLRRAIELEPGRADWYGNLALALAAQRRFAEGLASARTALAMEPGSARWQGLVGQLETLNRITGPAPDGADLGKGP